MCLKGKQPSPERISLKNQSFHKQTKESTISSRVVVHDSFEKVVISPVLFLLYRGSLQLEVFRE